MDDVRSLRHLAYKATRPGRYGSDAMAVLQDALMEYFPRQWEEAVRKARWAEHHVYLEFSGRSPGRPRIILVGPLEQLKRSAVIVWSPHYGMNVHGLNASRRRAFDLAAQIARRRLAAWMNRAQRLQWREWTLRTELDRLNIPWCSCYKDPLIDAATREQNRE